MSTITHITADELLAMPRDGMRRELISGELHAMSPAGFEHGRIGQRLAARLTQFAIDHGLGEVVGPDTGFVLTRDPDTVRIADVAFVGRSRIEKSGIPKSFYPSAPHLAIEVVSPSDALRKVKEKVDFWLMNGVVEVWVVHPEQESVTIYRSPTDFTMLTRDNMLESPRLLPGFRIPVHSVFPAS